MKLEEATWKSLGFLTYTLCLVLTQDQDGKVILGSRSSFYAARLSSLGWFGEM